VSFSFTLFYFIFFFFPQLPTLFPPGKGPFASLARLLTSTTAFATFVLLSGGCKSAGAYPTPFVFSFLLSLFPQLPTLFPPGKGPFASLARVSNLHHFYFLLIDMGLFKDRGVAMGKPHCNSSICNFRFCTFFKVNFAYTEFHFWHLSLRRCLSP